MDPQTVPQQITPCGGKENSRFNSTLSEEKVPSSCRRRGQMTPTKSAMKTLGQKRHNTGSPYVHWQAHLTDASLRDTSESHIDCPRLSSSMPSGTKPKPSENSNIKEKVLQREHSDNKTSDVDSSQKVLDRANELFGDRFQLLSVEVRDACCLVVGFGRCTSLIVVSAISNRDASRLCCLLVLACTWKLFRWHLT